MPSFNMTAPKDTQDFFFFKSHFDHNLSCNICIFSLLLVSVSSDEKTGNCFKDFPGHSAFSLISCDLFNAQMCP